jgi:lycopene beta-cyclase
MHAAMNERIAVVGAGLAGLSLALQLQRMAQFQGHLVLFEQRASYTDDRRWSFWPLRAHAFADVPSMAMPALRFVANGHTLQIDCAAAPYTSLAAGDVYAHALARLAGDSRFSIRFASSVQAIGQADDHVIVDVLAEQRMSDECANRASARRDERAEASRPLRPSPTLVHERFDRAFDARLPAGDWRFAQWFTGAELVLPFHAMMPQPMLMDFDIRQPGEVAFAYVLPQRGDRVLVQLTWFLPQGVAPPADARARWAHYVRDVLGLDPDAVVREESGVLPMHPFAAATTMQKKAGHAKPVQTRVHSIGTAAGWVRASTGYAFLDTQRAVERLAQALCATGDARTRAAAITAVRPRATLDDRLDIVLLEAMRAHPDAVASWFLRLFRDCSSPRLMRFLSGEANAWDRLAVMRALPPMPFLRAAWHTRGGRA